MSNFDDIFAGQNNGSQWRDKPFNKEEWAAKKQEERKEIYAPTKKVRGKVREER